MKIIKEKFNRILLIIMQLIFFAYLRKNDYLFLFYLNYIRINSDKRLYKYNLFFLFLS